MSTPSVSTVAIAGITGKLGTLTAEAMLETSQAQIRGFCRDKSKAAATLTGNPRVTIVEGQSDDVDAARRALRGSDVAICCYLGDDELMLHGQRVLIDAAVAEKVARYMASDYTLDYRKLSLGQLPAKDPMIHVVNYLKGKTIKGIHVIIGVFTETFFQYVGLWDPKNYQLSKWGSGNPWDLTTYGTAAQYMAAVALDPAASGFLKFQGDFVSINEMAKLFTSRYGSAPSLKTLGSLEDLRERIDTARAKNQIGRGVMPLFYTYYIESGQALLGENDNGRYPSVKPKSVRQFINENDLRTSAPEFWTRFQPSTGS